MTGELPLRQAVRALLIDPSDRVLLVKLDIPWTNWAGWVLPGGGIDEGESASDALCRELLEETGLRDPFIGPVVCRRVHRNPRMIPGFAGQQETIHLVPCHEFELAPTMSPEQLRAEQVVDMRWFTFEELRTTTEVLVPEPLVELVERVLEFGGTIEPLTVEVDD